MDEYPHFKDAICPDCAEEISATQPEGHQATYWEDICASCGMIKGCCSERDYGILVNPLRI